MVFGENSIPSLYEMYLVFSPTRTLTVSYIYDQLVAKYSAPTQERYTSRLTES
jgi:hypothetical protein